MIERPKPSFLHTESELTVQEGQHAFLNCKIRNIYNETVSCDFSARCIFLWRHPMDSKTNYNYTPLISTLLS